MFGRQCLPRSVIVPVMRVWEVRVCVSQWLVLVRMAVLGVGRDWRVVRVPVVFVMGVFMVVYHRLMGVRVPMVFSQMQPGAERHQSAGSDERHG